MGAVHLTATRFQRALTFFLTFVLPPSVIAAVFLVRDPAPVFVSVLAVVFMLLMFYGYGTMVTRLTVLPDGTLIASSLFRKKEFNVDEISKIDIRLWNKGMATLKTTRGELVFWRDTPGLPDVLRRIAADHPRIELKS